MKQNSWLVYRVALVVACVLLMLLSTTDGCLIVCNGNKVTTEKTIEQLQAHPFQARKSYKTSK